MQTLTSPEIVSNPASLTLETCDRCGPFVSASSVVTFANGHTLAFCAHHLRAYADHLPLLSIKGV